MFPSLPCFCCTPKAGKLLCFPVTCIMEVMASSEGGEGTGGGWLVLNSSRRCTFTFSAPCSLVSNSKNYLVPKLTRKGTISLSQAVGIFNY